MQYLEKQMNEYDHDLGKFIRSTGKTSLEHVPLHWFMSPDHVAIKCADSEHYNAELAVYEARSVRMTEARLNNRRLAAGELRESLILGKIKQIKWLEIMEPRPEKLGNDIVGLDHIEFLVPDLKTVGHGLQEMNVAYKFEANDGHSWLSIRINELGQELKFTDKPLAQVVEGELREGIAVELTV